MNICVVAGIHGNYIVIIIIIIIIITIISVSGRG